MRLSVDRLQALMLKLHVQLVTFRADVSPVCAGHHLAECPRRHKPATGARLLQEGMQKYSVLWERIRCLEAKLLPTCEQALDELKGMRALPAVDAASGLVRSLGSLMRQFAFLISFRSVQHNAMSSA
jgi:hypothetical protein